MRVRVLLQRCLQKDPKQRLRDIGDARISLDEVLTSAPEPTSAATPTVSLPLWRRALPWAIGLLALAVTGVAVWNLKPSPPRALTRTVITLPPGQGLPGRGLALSADGSQLAYVATTQGGDTAQIYLRALDSMEAKPISGTEGAEDPFFSPDGRWLGFFANGKLKKISVNGGVAQTLSDAAIPFGGSWGSQNAIVFAPGLSVLLQVSDGGGTPQPVTRFDKLEFIHDYPEFLPSGKAVLFVAEEPPTISAQIVGSVERRTLIQGGITPRYAPSGHLIYSQAGNLMAVPFDVERLEIKGAAVPVVQGVQEVGVIRYAQYSISRNGTLVYVPGRAQTSLSRMVWVTRNGTEQSLATPIRYYNQPRLSPDGRHVAVEITESGGTQVGVYDLARDTLTRLTFEGGNSLPVWTPDGKRIAFESDRVGPGQIFWQMADGSGGLERLPTGNNFQVPFSWAPDGKLLAFVEIFPGKGDGISVLSTDNHQVQPFLRTGAFLDAPQFSPDGRWIAYVSSESGRGEVYVQPYPGPGGKWQISTDGGNEPQWNRSGRELFYRNGDKMMAVDISTQSGFAAGRPRQVFEGHYLSNTLARANYDVSPDGQRFLMIKPVGQEQVAPTQINVVLNWTEELKRLVPTGNK